MQGMKGKQDIKEDELHIGHAYHFIQSDGTRTHLHVCNYWLNSKLLVRLLLHMLSRSLLTLWLLAGKKSYFSVKEYSHFWDKSIKLTRWPVGVFPLSLF